MDPPDPFDGEKPSPRRKELLGPRPAPLRVNKDSHKIKKPPMAPHPSHPPARLPPRPPSEAAPPDTLQPVIIYSVSPKVIHTTVSDFMNLVQRLTGSTSSSSGDADPFGATTSGGGGGAISPAARLASIQKTSPSEKQRERERAAEFSGTIEGVEMSQIPGILSPAPATLPPIPPGFFSPAADPFTNWSQMFTPSPSTLFSAPMVSPSPSSLDFFNPFFDF